MSGVFSCDDTDTTSFSKTAGRVVLSPVNIYVIRVQDIQPKIQIFRPATFPDTPQINLSLELGGFYLPRLLTRFSCLRLLLLSYRWHAEALRCQEWPPCQLYLGLVLELLEHFKGHVEEVHGVKLREPRFVHSSK